VARLVSWPFSRSDEQSFERVTPDEAARLRDAGAQVVDVREDSEWRRGHIPKSRHVPLRQVPARVGELDPQRPVVVVCASGHRSQTAAKMLAKLGFVEVYDLKGGLVAWQRQGLPLSG